MKACAYKIGEIKLRELRALAKSINPAVDVRAFHDFVLTCGPVPLNTLEDAVKEWAAKAARAA